MATLAAFTNPRLLTAEEFLQIDFGPGLRAELDNGVIRMMAGGTRDRARVQANLVASLRESLRGSGCRPYGSDMAVRTRNLSVRYPDVTIDCGGPDDAPDDHVLTNPHAVIEVLSPTTRDHDLTVKRAEYQSFPGLATIAFVDPAAETVQLLHRTDTGWIETFVARSDLSLPSLGVTIPHAEIFAQD